MTNEALFAAAVANTVAYYWIESDSKPLLKPNPHYILGPLNRWTAEFACFCWHIGGQPYEVAHLLHMAVWNILHKRYHLLLCEDIATPKFLRG